MNFYTVRDLRTSSREVWKKLSEGQEVIITNNGKPNALMIEVDDENLEEVLASVRQSMAMKAVNKIRLASINSGKANMTTEEIEEEISMMRKEKLKI